MGGGSEGDMERREFISTAAMASACAMAGVSAVAADGQAQPERKSEIRVTVLKKEFQKEYADKFRNGQGAVCTAVDEGRVYVVKSPWSKPEGFCDSAWADIRIYIHRAMNGQLRGPEVGCCTDGFRPVFFKIERVDV
jgi:uncharacterized repeat protein (TIGR04076 family)